MKMISYWTLFIKLAIHNRGKKIECIKKVMEKVYKYKNLIHNIYKK